MFQKRPAQQEKNVIVRKTEKKIPRRKKLISSPRKQEIQVIYGH